MDIYTDLPTLQLGCPGDSFLMPEFSRVYKKRQLDQLNRCRLYLQVITLADITTADGNTVTTAVWKGAKDLSRPSRYEWPKQHRSSEPYWEQFRLALGRCFHINLHSRALHNTLRSWNSSHQQLRFYFSPNDDRIYSRSRNGWAVHSFAHGRRRRFYWAQTNLIDQPLPLDAKQATVERAGQYLRVSGVSQLGTPSPEDHLAQPHDTFQAFLNNQDKDVAWCWAQLTLQGNLQDLLASLLQGTARGVSDGSFLKQYSFSTSSWTIYDPQTGAALIGANVLPGPPESQGSYRGEAGGLYGMVYAVCAIMEYSSQSFDTMGQIELGCDNDSCLVACFDDAYAIKASAPSHDLTTAVQKATARYPKFTWLPRIIQGHLDKHTPFEQLDDWSQKNVQMDANAKAYMTAQLPRYDHKPPQHPVRGQPWSVIVDGEHIIHDFEGNLRRHCAGPPILDYWTEKGKFGSKEAEDIDWQSTQKAMNSMSGQQQRDMTKFVSGQFGHNRNMFRWKKRDTDLCPLCGQAEETAHHVFTCTNAEATSKWDDGIQAMRQHLRKTNTMPSMVTLIASRLNAWRNNTADTEPIPAHLQEAVQAQDTVGWGNAFHGFWAESWATTQEGYYKRNNLKNTGERWLSALIRKLFEVAWDQWQYRNSIVHDKREGQVARLLEQEIRDEYNLGFRGFTLSIRPLTRLPMEELLAMRLQVQQSWLRRVQRQREMLPEAHQLQLQQQQTLMSQHFAVV